MSFTILGRKSSANVQKVHWICLEAKIDFIAKNIGGKYGGHDTDEFKKLNPNGTIPVLIDQDFILYESNAIIKYISNKYSFLSAEDNVIAATINQWMDWSSLVLGIVCANLTAHSMLLPEEKRDSKIVSEAQNKLKDIFDILNLQFEKNNFLLGDNLCLADIPIGCWINRTQILKIDISSHFFLTKWFHRLQDREAFKRAVVNAPLPPN